MPFCGFPVNHDIVMDFQRSDGAATSIFEFYGGYLVVVLVDQQVLDGTELLALLVDQRIAADVLRFMLELIIVERVEIVIACVMSHFRFPLCVAVELGREQQARASTLFNHFNTISEDIPFSPRWNFGIDIRGQGFSC